MYCKCSLHAWYWYRSLVGVPAVGIAWSFRDKSSKKAKFVGHHFTAQQVVHAKANSSFELQLRVSNTAGKQALYLQISTEAPVENHNAPEILLQEASDEVC